MAYVRRFITNSRSRSRSASIHLSTAEISDSQRTLLRMAQLQSLSQVFAAVSKGRSLPKKHPLFGAQLSIHQDVLHVSTRVRDRQSPSKPKQLILLLAKPTFIKVNRT